MILKSKQSILAICVGMVVAFVLVFFVRPSCWGPFLGILVAIGISKASGLKNGALIGCLVPVPAALYNVVLLIPKSFPGARTPLEYLQLAPSVIVGSILVLIVGAIYGAILGKIYQVINERKTVIF